ncbi:hypothetical protein KALB_3962 [Kutzneria albida DSM 43870]|uniref:Uncharacterized protein n=1 Tax=Kutzneria albida DSM 43870 TaxID=1449976 RepID=W5W9W2_9PSEU|nr:hypothetical protein KALB_3962 [Kutzneria albida DSM 43870]
MDPTIIELKAELRGLCRGRGVQDADIGERVGPHLAQLCGIGPGDRTVRVRGLLVDYLRNLIKDLPDEFLLVTVAAFGLNDTLRGPYLDARLAKVKDQVDREKRTVLRWLDKACLLLAQGAVERAEPERTAPGATGPWHTAELQASVVLDLPVPEVIETRRIVADQDDLEAVELSMTLEPPPGWTGEGSPRELGLDVLYGGLLAKRVMKSTRRVGFVLRLPHPLGRNKEHEYAVRVRFSPNQPIAPYYVCTPSYPCRLFRLRVRFGPERVPGSIWRLHEALATEVGDSPENRKQVFADPCGEVYSEFSDLVPRSSYGIAWSQDLSPVGGAGGRSPS